MYVSKSRAVEGLHHEDKSSTSIEVNNNFIDKV